MSSLHRIRPSFDNAPDPGVDYERFFLDLLPLLERIVRGVGRRYGLEAEEVADLLGAIHVKIIDRDYEVLRRYERRAQIGTYLTAVVVRHVLDDLIERRGKWRPSVEAQRRGPVATLLERLMMRDGLTFDQAVETLRTNHHITELDEELDEMRRSFPVRSPRRFVSDEALWAMPSGSDADADAAEGDRARLAAKVLTALVSVVAELDPQDQLLLKMLFRDDLQIARVAKLLKVEPKALYRRVDRIRRKLRQGLEARGVTRDDARDVGGFAKGLWDAPETDEEDEE